MEILIGCDPEFFVKKDGKHVSAHDLVPGTKSRPHFVEAGAVQVDGMALEYNIIPSRTREEFIKYNKLVLSQLREMVPPEYEFDFVPVAHFERDYIDSQPTVARVLGCSPDYNAYTGQTNIPPDSDMNFRTASGHIHIGWTNDMDPYDQEHFEACCMAATQLDYSLYLASLIYDEDRTRPQLYGKPGAFRPKSYGMEYRVVSNAWLKYDWGAGLVYDVTTHAINDLLGGLKYWEHYGDLMFNIHSMDKAPLDYVYKVLKGVIPSAYFPKEFKNLIPKPDPISKLNLKFDPSYWDSVILDTSIVTET